MSYEGYTQNICEEGHRFDTDVGCWFGKEPLCPVCSAKVCWSNGVDQTNFEEDGFIPDEDFARFLHTPGETQVCSLGHTHIVRHATYLVPTQEQVEPLRTYIDGWDGDVPMRLKCR